MDPRFTASHRGGSGAPMVCLHGFTDTWRTWELVLPELERHQALDRHASQEELVRGAAPHADRIVESEEGRRGASLYTTVRFDHIPPELLAHQIRGAAGCDAALPLLDHLRREGYGLDAEKITCRVRIVWGAGAAPDRARPS